MLDPADTRFLYTAASDLDAELKLGQYRALYGGMALPFEATEQ